MDLCFGYLYDSPLNEAFFFAETAASLPSADMAGDGYPSGSQVWGRTARCQRQQQRS